MDEFGLIDSFVRQFDVAPSPGGPGDDCAVLGAQGPSCVTTDAVVEGVHFTRRAFSMEDVGHKALAVNLSDLAAMGARPGWFTVALGVPEDVTARDLVTLGRGMSALARLHGARLVGGNVTKALQLSVTITLSGLLDGPPMLRSGGAPGDVLYLSGAVGDAAGGLTFPRALGRAQRRPAPQLAFGQRARAFATAAIDVSDGLAQDLGHLCAASGVGAALSSAAIPLSEALVRAAGSRAAALELGLRGGEDYALLVAVRSPGRFEAKMQGEGFAVHRIGALTKAKGLRLDGARLQGKLGWMHR